MIDLGKLFTKTALIIILIGIIVYMIVKSKS